MTPSPPAGAPMRGPFPRRDCHLVNDRPVQLVGTPDGGLDCVVYDWRSGSFVVDRSYFGRTIPGDSADVDALDAATFDAIVAHHRVALVASMADRLAAADGADVAADASVEVLGIDPAVPPFDALAMEPVLGPGIVVVEPRLLTVGALDDRFGRSSTSPGPDGTVLVGHRVGGCAITSLVAVDVAWSEVVVLTLARVV